ncbi:MAG: hypothetical protein PHN82_08090 [bacterium]|nr:hypothetical protein [bacterium]
MSRPPGRRPAGAAAVSARRWFAGFAAYVAALLLLLAWASSAGREEARNLLLFVLAVSFACQFIPLPIIPVFLWIARTHNPFLIALLGAAATSVANLHDYHILTALMRWERLDRVRDTPWFARAAAWFARCPFWTLVVANILPLPIDVPRLLAISTGYGRLPFTLATFTGRVPRYLLLAWLGYELKLSNTAILVVLAVTVALSVAKTVPKLLAKRRGER